MPELPEVEFAARVLRASVEGKSIARVAPLHAAHRRRLAQRHARQLRGIPIVRVERRGKHQLLRLANGATVHVHFRMTGGWHVGRVDESLPPYARLVIELNDGTRVSLVDPRALSTVTLHPPGSDPLPRLGPDATDPELSRDAFGNALAARRSAIKVALLDQRVLAGVGNIYAAEALWLARIDPRARASSLSASRRARLLDAIRQTLRRAEREPTREGDATGSRFRVYDREGQSCRRCGTRIRRIVQASRSTYYCPTCQRR